MGSRISKEYSFPALSVAGASDGSIVLLLVAGALALIGAIAHLVGTVAQRYGAATGVWVALGIVAVFVLGNLGCMRLSGSNR